MAELPNHYRDVFHMVQVEGLTLAEAGVRIGRSAGAAEKLYGRALAQLARLVSDGADGRDA